MKYYVKLFATMVFLLSDVTSAQTGRSVNRSQAPLINNEKLAPQPVPVVDPVAQAISAQVQVTKQNLQNVMDQL